MLPPALGGLRVSRAAGPWFLGSREYSRAVARKTLKLYYFKCSVVKSQNSEISGGSEIRPCCGEPKGISGRLRRVECSLR